VEAHGEDLRDAGASEALVRAIKRDPRRAQLEGPSSLLRDFAIKLTLVPGAMVEADVKRLRAAGLQDEDILDAVEIVAYFNYINRVADGLGIDPEPEWPRQPTWYRNVRSRRRATAAPRPAARSTRRRPRRR
jgi:uncharacterized peroxidase-related enzyme